MHILQVCIGLQQNRVRSEHAIEVCYTLRPTALHQLAVVFYPDNLYCKQKQLHVQSAPQTGKLTSVLELPHKLILITMLRCLLDF